MGTTKPDEWDCVIATVRAVNNGPAAANVYLVTGENNGYNQEVDYYDETSFTLQPRGSKTVYYESGGHKAGCSTYFASKATVTNTTDPNLANNFARSAQITWQALAPPSKSTPSELDSSLIY